MTEAIAGDSLAEPDEVQLLVQAAAEARLLAAEREHELIELRKRIAKYEGPLEAEEDVREEEEFSEVITNANAEMGEGKLQEALETYVMAIGSLWNRYQQEKRRTKARLEVEAEVQQKWIDEMNEKENTFHQLMKSLEEESLSKLQSQQVDFVMRLEQQQNDFQTKLEKQKVDFDTKMRDIETSFAEKERGFEAEKENLAGELSNLRANLTDLEREKATFETSLKAARDKATETSTLLDQNKEKMRGLWKKHQMLKEEAAKKEHQIADLQSKLETVQSRALTEAVPRIVGLSANQARLEELQAELLTSRSMLEQVQAARANESEARLAEQARLESERAVLQEQVRSFESRASAFDSEKSDLEGQLKSLASIAERESAQLAQEIEARRVAVEQHAADLVRANERVEQLVAQLQELEKVRNQEKEELNFECATLREDVLTANNRLIATETLLREAEASLAEAQSANEALRSDLATLQSASSSVPDLESKLQEALQARDQLEAQLQEQSTLSDEMTRDLSARLQDALGAKDAFEKQVGTLRQEMTNEHVAQLAGLAANQARLEQLEAELVNERAQAESRVAEAAAAVRLAQESSQAQITELQTKLTDAETRAQEATLHIQSRVAALDEQLAAREIRIADLEATIGRLQGQVSQLEERGAMSEQVTVLQAQLQKAEADLKDERDRYELLTVESEDLMGERNKLKATLDEEHTKLQQALVRTQILEDELAKVRHDLTTERVTRIPALEANAKRIEELEASLKQHVSAATESAAEQPQNTQRIYELEAQVIAMREVHATKVFQLEAEILRGKDELEMRASAERRLAHLEKDLEDSRATSQLLQIELETVRSDREAIRAKEEMVRNELIRLQQSSSTSLSSEAQLQRERDDALAREKDLAAECEALRRRADELNDEVRVVASSKESSNVEGAARSTELERELKRVRAEAAFNVKNLQAECEALRRRVEELGVEQDLRGQHRTRAASEDISLPAGPLRRNISEVEAQRGGGLGRRRFFSDHYDGTPESQSHRQRPLLGGEERKASVPRMQSFDVVVPDHPTLSSSSPRSMEGSLPHPPLPLSGAASPSMAATHRERELESELKRVRAEAASTTKNLQSECEALRRRVEDLLESARQQEVGEAAPSAEPRGEPATSSSTTRPHHQRTISEVESQRRRIPAEMLDTPESQRTRADPQLKIRNPVRALRLTPTRRAVREKVDESTEGVAAAAERTHELEEEIKRMRAEYSETTKNLQAECEALRRRLDEVGAEQDARDRSMQGEETVTTPPVEVPPRSISALESQRSHASFASLVVLGEQQEDIEEEALRGQEQIVDDHGNGGQRDLEAELLRLREESALNIRNFQAETEALRRRINELEAEKAAETEVIRRQDEDRSEKDRLRARVRHLEQTEAEIRSQMETLQVLQTVASEKDRELKEALERLQAGNETLDDLRTSLQGAQGRFAYFGDRAQSLVTSVSRLQAERDAMKIQIQAAYGLGQEEEEEQAGVVTGQLDHAVDAAHAASDEALHAAKSLAQELAQLAQEEDIAKMLADALDDAKACLQIALQLEGAGVLATRLSAVTEAIAQTVEHQDEAVEQTVQHVLVGNEQEEEVLATDAGEETVEKPVPSSPVSNGVHGAGSPPVVRNEKNDFFINRILELEKDRAALMDRLSRAETELAIRKDLFAFVAASSSGVTGTSETKPFETPSKFSLFNKKAGTGASGAITPWKNAAWRPSSAVKPTPARSKEPEAESKEAGEWSNNAGDWAASNGSESAWQQQSQEGVWEPQQLQQPWDNAASAMPTETTNVQAGDWDNHQQQWNASSEPAPTSSAAWEATVSTQAPQVQAEPTLHKQDQTLATMATPAAVKRRTAKTGTTETTEHGKTEKKNKGPGILAIAFGIGTYHPEWKPDPTELEEDNSDFEDESAGNDQPLQQQQPPSMGGLTLPSETPAPPSSGLMAAGEPANDPFAAAAKIHSQSNSPRFQTGPSSDPFAAPPRQHRLSSDLQSVRRASFTVVDEQQQPGSRRSSFAAPPASWAASTEQTEQTWTDRQETQQQQHGWAGQTEWNSGGESQQQSWGENGGGWDGAELGKAESVNEWGEKVDSGVQSGAPLNEWGESVPSTVQGEITTATAWGETIQGEIASATFDIKVETVDDTVASSQVERQPQVNVEELNAGLAELTRKNEELQGELAAEREARLFRESQFEVAESNLFTVVQEAEQLKRRIRDLEADLQDARMIVETTAAARLAETEPSTPVQPSFIAPVAAPFQVEDVQPTTTTIANGISEEELARREEEFFTVRAELESTLQDALQTIEDLQKRLEEQVRQQQEQQPQQKQAPQEPAEKKPTSATPTVGTEEMEELRQSLHQREEDVQRLTAQLAKATYAWYRAKEECEHGQKWTTTLSLAAASFTLSAFFPTEAAIVKIVNMISGE